MSTRIGSNERPAATRVVRTPVQARSRATVEAILGGTARVLASRGYAKASTNHIAEAAGVSIGSFYQYFADKDAAVAACAEHYAHETLAFAWEHVDDGLPQRSPIACWLDALLARACENESLVRVLFHEVPYTWTLPGVRDAMAGALAVVERLAGDALTASDRRHDGAYVILRAAVSVITDVAADPDLRPRRSAIVDELARMIDAYLDASRGPDS
jgi:AcrR family transcriptional regulator